MACGVWDDFRKHAVREGWFAPNGAEAATLYLHMASVLRKIPGKLLREIQRSARPQKKGAYEDLHFLFPERLYERKVALDGAKGIHKAQGTAASEALLVDAYAARIRSLLGQGLAVEAKALIDLVRDRYPSARERLEELTASAVARAGTLDELVGPLNDPAISHERRAAIEHAIQRDVRDLAALAECAALAPEDSMRKAACALERAFLAVTTGPVADVC
ncbi:MAG: hypothetical protein DMG57_36870 [Acidobacteria bacterium]|nr:MAG: hypothetical protein DMG57_36870 [Acidobacteriota bacterium]